MQIIRYTSNTNNYDDNHNKDILQFNDTAKILCNQTANNFIQLNQHVYANRIVKIMYFLFLQEHDINIYHDANIVPLLSDSELVEKYLKNNDICIFKHPFRNCLYDEAATLKSITKYKNDKLFIEKLDAQVNYYKNANMPKNFGLTENCFIIRRNNDKTRTLMTFWLTHLLKYQYRDQIRSPFVLHKFLAKNTDYKFHSIEIDNNIRLNKDFLYFKH